MSAEDLCIFFDFSQQISIGERAAFGLVQLREVVVFSRWHLVHDGAPNFLEAHHMLLELSVAREEILVDQIELGQHTHLQILNQMLDLRLQMREISDCPLLLPLDLFLEVL